MKTLLVTLNAKYIHTSLALRWLYVANRERFDISFREFTLKEDLSKVVDEIMLCKSQVVGLSVYIWNVEQSRQLAQMIKTRSPKTIIILGGPEVSYAPQHFLDNWQVDYVVSGEGERVLGELLGAIESGSEIEIDGVSYRGYISPKVAQADLEELSKLPSPYMLEQDTEHRANKLLYFETSRGCPYRCQYCLSSLEKGVRYFPLEYTLRNLLEILESDVKQIKFLDRTFNLNHEHTHAIFDLLITHHRPGLVCQFEIYADLLDDKTIDYLNDKLPAGYFRFEIGIQSTHEPTNMAVDRRQDFTRLAHNVRRLMEGGKVALHLDLIAGLPHETLERFARSFNDVFSLGAKEVQLGFLKMLRGTALRRDAAQYGYIYDPLPPYQIESNNDISAAELERIHQAEHALDKFWNSGRFNLTMGELFSTHYAGRYFEFFEELAQFCIADRLPPRGYQLEDLFATFHRFLHSKNIELSEVLREDYYGCFTQRPHGFWQQTMDKSRRKQLIYQIGQDREFLTQNGLSRNDIEKLTSLYSLSDRELLLTVFFPQGGRRSFSYTFNDN